jgi:hypothetical protein
VRKAGFVYVRFHFQSASYSTQPPGVETLLGAFAKLRQAAIELVMSVCLSVCVSPHATTRLVMTEFDEI